MGCMRKLLSFSGLDVRTLIKQALEIAGAFADERLPLSDQPFTNSAYQSTSNFSSFFTVSYLPTNSAHSSTQFYPSPNSSPTSTSPSSQQSSKLDPGLYTFFVLFITLLYLTFFFFFQILAVILGDMDPEEEEENIHKKRMKKTFLGTKKIFSKIISKASSGITTIAQTIQNKEVIIVLFKQKIIIIIIITS